jgi:hypothetical protein
MWARTVREGDLFVVEQICKEECETGSQVERSGVEREREMWMYDTHTQIKHLDGAAGV